jgi:hypothetical protein
MKKKMYIELLKMDACVKESRFIFRFLCVKIS